MLDTMPSAFTSFIFHHLDLILVFSLILTTLLAILTYRLYKVLSSQPRKSKPTTKAHLLIVLGSGGHTSEMISLLTTLGHEYLNKRFSRRTYMVTSGDHFSIERARSFEAQSQTSNVRWSVNVVHRARKVHQPIYTTPASAFRCYLDCVRIMARDPPDLVFLNGPGTAVVVVLAGLSLMIFGAGHIRTVYVESWARVKTLSLSGRILRWMVSRFLVQWRALADVDLTTKEKKSWRGVREYVGPVVT